MNQSLVTSSILTWGGWLLAISLIVASYLFWRWVMFGRRRDLRRLAEWMRHLRTGAEVSAVPPVINDPELISESDRLAATLRAARSVNLADSEEAVRAERLWDSDRLRTHALASIGLGQLIVVSNREPYMHKSQDEAEPLLVVPAGGLVAALDPVLRACGGLWVAHGAGGADRETADADGRLTVPPDEPRYTLRRVWMSREEEQGYYYGFSNEGLWPLCHMAHERPVFRESDWEQYQAINQRFADTVIEEVGDGEAMVLVQDYQLALVPMMIKQQRPDLKVALFWHIPWPHPEAFRTCPWRQQILTGMLGADLVGFHLQQYCNNFFDTVDRTIEARIDRDRFAVELGGSPTVVRPFPIGIEGYEGRDEPVEPRLLGRMRKRGERDQITLAVGVDRIDYTKGIAERFLAVRRLLEKYPEHRGRFTLVQLGAPSRTHIRRYRELITELESLAEGINWDLQSNGWKPIHFLVGHHDSQAVRAWLSEADLCVVTSLHDGMNLVAKEFVASRTDDSGALILSEFAGAAVDLPDALLINPYDTEQCADQLHTALTMDATEMAERMSRMRQSVEEHNVHWWAASLIGSLAQIEHAAPQVAA